MNVDEGISDSTEAVKNGILELKSLIDPILKQPFSELYGKLETLDQAKINVTLSFAINSLAFAYLKLQGISPFDHASFKEMERIRLYIEKIKRAQNKHSRPAMQVDQKAAKRFIKHALSGNPDQDEEHEVKKENQKRKATMDPFQDVTAGDKAETSSQSTLSEKKKKKKKKKKAKAVNS